MYAVTLEPLNSVYFLADRPGDGPWTVDEGVELDLTPQCDIWLEGSPRPEQEVTVSVSDPKHYKIFKYSRDIDPELFRPTGKRFGGIFSKRVWEKFAMGLQNELRVRAIPDDDPPGAFDEAMRLIREAR
jgi:hypothetical protein